MPITRRELVATGAVFMISPRIDRIDATPHHGDGGPMTALSDIRQIDYTVVFARDMPAMRHFYETIMEFPLHRVLGEAWIEFRVGSNILALTTHGNLFEDTPPAPGTLSLQMAFRVAPEAVRECAAALEAKGVKLALPVTDQPWRHRTVFFRDPDGNVLEIYADI